MVLWLNSVIKDGGFSYPSGLPFHHVAFHHGFVTSWAQDGSHSYRLYILKCKQRQEAVHQPVYQERAFITGLSSFINTRKTFPEVPAQNWAMGPLLRVKDVGTVSTLPVVEVGGKSEKGWRVACQQHLPHLPYPGTCPNAPRKHPYGRVTEQF